MKFAQRKLVLSPMAGITDAPFRYLATNLGADYAISEMITSQTQLWQSNKTSLRLKSDFIEQPKIIQIGGASPQLVVQASQAAYELGADIVEINMGCPAKKVCNVLSGSALLRNEKLVAQILQETVKAVSIPIYLKTRLGWDEQQQNILTIAQIAQDAGVKSLTIHGRTRCDFYLGEARYELIAQVKQLLSIPVFANGDITTPQQAYQVLEFTNADGLYIGRGALGQPWLFEQIKTYLTKQDLITFTSQQKFKLINHHLNLIHQHYGEPLALGFARKHIKWYLQANPQLFTQATDELFSQFAQLTTTKQQLELFKRWCSF
ncbi:MAG: tRNA-dihydrouridine synthase [Pseudomonadota bacterium]|jgi:tRNA-dihydrouridine synthase B